MYKNLKTNFAKEGMAFPDFPFPEEYTDSYVTHREIRDYLQAYCDSVDGNKCIKFNTTVCSVTPSGTDSTWKIVYKSIMSDDAPEEQSEYDAVFVCNGHYDIPNKPTIPGLKEHFKGLAIHSRDYKVPERFAGKKVVILGGANSGQDIAVDIAQMADHVTISHNLPPIPSNLPSNMSQCPGIVSCNEKGLVCLDGSVHPHPDALIFATGYRFSLPFLDDSCGIISDDFGHIQPLYKHFVNAHFPTMFLIGICQNVAAWPMYYMQAQAALAIVEKRFWLPNYAEMMEDIERNYQEKMRIFGREKFVHDMTHEQWGYNDELAKIAGCTPVQSHLVDVYYKCAYMRRHHLTYYRNYRFIVEDEHANMIPVNGAPEIDEESQLSMKPAVLPGKDEEDPMGLAETNSQVAFYSSGPSSIDESSSSGQQSANDSESSDVEEHGSEDIKGYRSRGLPVEEQVSIVSQLERS